MKIYSWNTALNNTQIDTTAAFIAELEFDVLALQEVTPKLLEKLKALPYNITHSTDFLYQGDQTELEPLSLVVLSRYPIVKELSVSFPDEWYTGRWRFLGRVLRRVLGWTLPYMEKTSLHTEIQTPKGIVQVACCHLSLGLPAIRRKEFGLVMEQIDPTRPVVICGDLNILERSHANILNWLAGDSIQSALHLDKERKDFEMIFKAYDLKNPLRGHKTQRVALSQLDHILVPAHAVVRDKRIIKKRYGSDHNPVMVEIDEESLEKEQ